MVKKTRRNSIRRNRTSGSKIKSRRKTRGKRKRKSKHKRQRGGFKEVELYQRQLDQLEKAHGPTAIVEACNEMQRLMKPKGKNKTFGCMINLKAENRKNCREQKLGVLNDIINNLDNKSQIRYGSSVGGEDTESVIEDTYEAVVSKYNNTLAKIDNKDTDDNLYRDDVRFTELIN